MRLEPVVLEGRHVRLEPYAPAVREAVRAALDVDPESWRLFVSPGYGAGFEAWWDEAVAQQAAGRFVNYAVRRRSDGRVVGSTSFLDITPPHRRVEIGATFLHPDARGGAVNPEAKLLMLDHAFAAGAIRVEIVADARNIRSLRAIAALGAEREANRIAGHSAGYGKDHHRKPEQDQQ
jgi:RimJ/RimL family protein N-acetyltransferase